MPMHEHSRKRLGLPTDKHNHNERESMTTTLTLSGKALASVTTWERFASASVECQVWSNPEWPEHVEPDAIALAKQRGFQLFTADFKEGLHGKERVRKYARRSQDFWTQFAIDLGFKYRSATEPPATA